MTGERFYEGYDFDHWAEALAGPRSAPVYWRPGGGFYEDSVDGGLAGKSHDIGRQVSLLPPEVVSIQSEIENFPYHRLKKAAHITVLEAASHMAAGCTGAAFNVLSGNDEPLDEFEPMVAAIRDARPFLRSLGTAISALVRPSVFALRGARTRGRPILGMLGQAPPVWEIGLPAAYSSERRRRDAAVLRRTSPPCPMTKSRRSSPAVYMDAETLDALNRRGFGELTGLTVERDVAARTASRN